MADYQSSHTGAEIDAAVDNIKNVDLSAAGFTPVANTYYKHTGTTTSTFTQGVIYYYNGTEYKAINGSGGIPTIEINTSATSGTLTSAQLNTLLNNDLVAIVIDSGVGSKHIFIKTAKTVSTGEPISLLSFNYDPVAGQSHILQMYVLSMNGNWSYSEYKDEAKLIETITLTEATSTIYRQNYQYKFLSFYITIPQASNDADILMRLNENNVFFCGTNAIRAGTVSGFNGYLDCTKGVLVCDAKVGANSDYYAISIDPTMYHKSFCNAISEINTIRFSANPKGGNPAMFPVGTEIKIYAY